MSVPAAFLGIIIIWSTTPLTIKWSGEGPGFLFGVTGRMALGAAVALLALMVLRVPLPLHGKAWRTYLAAGLGIYGAMISVYAGAQYVASGLVSVLYGTMPLITGIMASLWLQERTLTGPKIIGILLGMLGLWQIFGHGLQLGNTAWIGLAYVLLSVVLQSISAVWVKRVNPSMPGLTVTCGGLLLALPLYLLTWGMFGEGWPQAVPERALLSIVYLGVFGSAIGFALYYYVLSHMEASKVALAALITPVLALMLGHWLNNEAMDAQVWMGTAAILAGLAAHQWGDYLYRRVGRTGD
ncbi:MAG: multidrug DMT transporter [Gammaproteobacteria bacterium RBG_16_57_12]|nr:MAG: multidrug DMT transporter [Gammaproteobacteria bacterium RBG_16_57_12]